MPYDFTSPTATEHQLEEPAALDSKLPAKVGHPVTVYSQQTVERVCELIATGHNLRQIEEMRATEPELPARRTIHDWVKTRPDFERAYYIALEARASARADEMIRIARDATIPDRLANRQIRTLKFLMGKEAPKRYGKPAEMVVGEDIAPQRPTDAP
jgi:hypothetical protein